MLHIYTDGACEPNPGPGSWAFIHVMDNKVILENCGFHPSTTNNRMEFSAAIQAIKSIPITQSVIIHSDSRLLVNTYQSWMHSWFKKGWKKKKGPVANLDLVKELWDLKHQYQLINFQWIKAHNGHIWNEYVDEMCSWSLLRRRQ